MYGANRWRAPHEYVNYWKWKEDAFTRAAKENLEVPDEIDLLEQWISAREDLEREKGRHHEYEDEIDKQNNELARLRNKATERHRRAVRAQANEATAKGDYDLVTTALLKYGDHEGDCAWLEACASARIIKGINEDNTCDCGWVQKKLEFKNKKFR